MARRVMAAEGAGGFAALWGAISRLARGKGLPSTQFDKLRAAPAPSGRFTKLWGGTYSLARHPVLIGPGKCRKKGHRPPPRWARVAGVDHCTRCAPGWEKQYS